MRESEIEIGATYHRWTVVAAPFRDERGRLRVPVRCICGNSNPALFGTGLGTTAHSCGCYQRERVAKANFAHGDHKERLYRIWIGFRQRCNNPNRSGYKDYGGRGITYAKAWDSYPVFKEWALRNGYKAGLELDRANNDGNYTPRNCKWSTRDEQARNTSRVRMLSAFGEAKIMVEWVEDRRCIVGYGTLESRMRRGWEAERAMTTPAETKFRVGR